MMGDDALLTTVSGKGEARRLEIQYTLEAPIASVWSAITNIEEVSQWWTGGALETREGGRVVLEDGSAVNGTVKTWCPPHIFEFTWNDTPKSAGHPHLIEPRTKSLVRFDLVDVAPARTQLTFIQFNPAAEVVGSAAGWHQIVGERLREYVRGSRDGSGGALRRAEGFVSGGGHLVMIQ